MTSVTRSGSIILPVAGNAVPHVQPSILIDLIHCLYWAVAGLALKPSGQVLPVTEIYEGGHLMNPDPFDWTTGFIFLSQLDDIRLACGNHVVASHANIHGRHSSVSGALRIAMAVKAGNLIIAGMDLVAERQGLLRRISLIVICLSRKSPQAINQNQEDYQANSSPNLHVKSATYFVYAECSFDISVPTMSHSSTNYMGQGS